MMIKKRFEQLTNDELYAILQLRQDVFIVEQQSIYRDLDGYDQSALHYLCWDHINHADALVGYARYRKDEQVNEIKIERVVLSQAARGKGVGQSLMKKILDDIQGNTVDEVITLSSQLDASKFYQNLGFEITGLPYDDGGIEHIKMTFQA